LGCRLEVSMNLKAIESPALYKFIGYLDAVSDFIRTGELKCTLVSEIARMISNEK
jgi:hypothetical protein